MTEQLRLTPALIAELCRAAATLAESPEVLVDPLDCSFWVRLQSADAGERAVRALAAAGVSASTGSPGRVHAAGWDARLLRRRLGVALAGVDDLMAEWDATAELARYHWDRRIAVAGRAELWEVLAEVERVMRSSIPLPHTAPSTDDIAVLLELIEQAENAYARLLGEHLEHAERALADHAAGAAAAQE
jgi:hypothetical protein